MSSETAGTILVVDDTPTNLSVLLNLLNHAGFKVLVAGSGERAIEIAHDAQPDLILLDILMPELDGFETCRHLKASETTRSIPIIFLSALCDCADKVKGFQQGAVDFISKPFQAEEVIARVSTHVRLQTLTKQLQNQSDRLAQEKQERQRIEANLQDSENIFHRFAENLQTVVWLANRDLSEIFYVNPAYEKIWGRSCDSLKQAPNAWIDAICPEDRDRVLAQLEQQHQGLPVNMEYRIQRPDGSIRWIWDRGFAVPDTQGEVDYFGGIAEDITERKQTEIQLREMSAALGNAVEGISRLDEQGRYIFINDAYARTVGYMPEEMLGMNWQKTVHPDDLEPLIAAYQHMLEQGKVELEADRKSVV